MPHARPGAPCTTGTNIGEGQAACLPRLVNGGGAASISRRVRRWPRYREPLRAAGCWSGTGHGAPVGAPRRLGERC